MSMRIRSLTVAAGAALLLTGCGSSPLDGKTGPEVAAAAADALDEAGSVHMAGTVDQGGQQGDVDLHLQGEDATGSITLGGFELQLVNVDGAAYVQGPPEFWSAFGIPAEDAGVFEGQWVVVPADAAAAFAEFSLTGIVDNLRNPASGIKDDVRSAEVDGTDVVVVEQEDGSTLSVADDDPSYPVELTREGDSTGSLTFSRYGEEETIEAPADALELEQVLGGG
jgi:hypothetical protein